MQWVRSAEVSDRMMGEPTALFRRCSSVSSERFFDRSARPWNNGDIVKLIEERKAASDD